MTHADTLEYPDRIQSKFYIGKSIPWNLLKLAMRGTKGSLSVYLAAWCLFSMTRRRTITLKRSFLDNSGMSGSTISAGIDECVRLGLLEEVQRSEGRSPVLYIKKESEIEEGQYEL